MLLSNTCPDMIANHLIVHCRKNIASASLFVLLRNHHGCWIVGHALTMHSDCWVPCLDTILANLHLYLWLSMPTPLRLQGRTSVSLSRMVWSSASPSPYTRVPESGKMLRRVARAVTPVLASGRVRRTRVCRIRLCGCDGCVCCVVCSRSTGQQRRSTETCRWSKWGDSELLCWNFWKLAVNFLFLGVILYNFYVLF